MDGFHTGGPEREDSLQPGQPVPRAEPAPPPAPLPPAPPPPVANAQVPVPVSPATPQPATTASAVTPAAGSVSFDGVEHVPAGLWPRVGAFLIDWVILSLLFMLMSWILDVPQFDPELQSAAMMVVLMEVLLETQIDPLAATILDHTNSSGRFVGWMRVAMCCAYFTLLHGLAGATIGKLLLGLKVRRRDGRGLGLGLAFLRYVGYLFVAKLYYTAWLIPMNRERRALYDMVLNTNVFKKAPRKA